MYADDMSSLQDPFKDSRNVWMFFANIVINVNKILYKGTQNE